MKTCPSNYRLLVFAAGILLVTACGQKGPLYLPDPSQQQAKQYEPEQNKQGQDNQKKQEKKNE